MLPVNKAVSEDCILLRNRHFQWLCGKKKSLPPQIENENDTYLVYEVKFPFPLGATQYHREI